MSRGFTLGGGKIVSWQDISPEKGSTARKMSICSEKSWTALKMTHPS